jgi:hypothetical protein
VTGLRSDSGKPIRQSGRLRQLLVLLVKVHPHFGQPVQIPANAPQDARTLQPIRDGALARLHLRVLRFRIGPTDKTGVPLADERACLRITNAEASHDLIADLLEIKGEIIYKTLAYRKAAESLKSLGRDASENWKEDKLQEIPGVGKAISEKIDECYAPASWSFSRSSKP